MTETKNIYKILLRKPDSSSDDN